MGFFAPWFLAGAVAVGLPVWLHLLKRHKTDPKLFPSLMFFEYREVSSMKHRRLEHLLLLALLHRQLAFPQAFVLLLDLQCTFSEVCRYRFEVLLCCLRGRLESFNYDALVRYRSYQRQTGHNKGQQYQITKQTAASRGLEKVH